MKKNMHTCTSTINVNLLNNNNNVLRVGTLSYIRAKMLEKKTVLLFFLLKNYAVCWKHNSDQVAPVPCLQISVIDFIFNLYWVLWSSNMRQIIVIGHRNPSRIIQEKPKIFL